jgi:hypothetical protein
MFRVYCGVRHHVRRSLGEVGSFLKDFGERFVGNDLNIFIFKAGNELIFVW